MQMNIPEFVLAHFTNVSKQCLFELSNIWVIYRIDMIYMKTRSHVNKDQCVRKNTIINKCSYMEGVETAFMFTMLYVALFGTRGGQ